MAATLLHLVDDSGKSVPKTIRLAVEAAHQWALIDYKNFDQAVLAGIAEEVAIAMCRRLDSIQSPRRYALAALRGKLQEWYRAHPGVEILMEADDLELAAGPSWRSFTATHLGVWLAQARSQLNERDCQILGLIEQDLGSPGEIAKALGISYAAAAKAVQRVKQRMAALLISDTNGDASGHEVSASKAQVNLRIW